MAKTLDERSKALLQDKNFAHVAIPRQNGTVQAVVLWVHATDDGKVEINSVEGRDWPENLRRAGSATISVANAANPYEYIAVTGRLVEDTHDGADEHIDFLAKKYLDLDSYPYRQAGEQRIKFVLEPDSVVSRWS